MHGVLDGLRVVDFGHYIAGPLLGQVLADNGADVVHIDPPGGPRLKGLPDAYLNRGKRRISLDLRDASDLAVARDLASRADVLVENFRPGVMARLGLSAEELSEDNPRLVYCALPGFAAGDPRAKLAAWEGVIMSATGGYRRLHEHWDWKARTNVATDDPGRPLFTAVPIASNIGALLGALAVVMALLQRERSGTGARLEIPLAEAMLEVVGFHLEMPDFVGRRDNLPRPFLGSYRCADDRFVDQVPYPRFVERFLTAAGAWDDWCAAGFGSLAEVFGDPVLTVCAEDFFTKLMRSRPAAHWENLALGLNIPMTLVRTPLEWRDHQHARTSGTVIGIDDPEYGSILTAGSVMQFSHMSVSLIPRSLPDADRDSVVATLRHARDAGDPANPTTTRAVLPQPLAGVSVVELSQVVAGPIAGRLLADYGADVIKIVNPSPDGNNGFHGSYTNRGKRTVLLDVQDADDRDMLRAAVDRADILLQNYAHGAVERYGLGYDALHRENPSLVYVSLGAFPGPGPWQGRRGHENQAVAATGLSARYGGEGGWPIYQPYLICDVGTGVAGALGAALGLYHQRRCGEGLHVRSSLAQVATLHQGVYLFDGPPDARLPEPTGPDARGWSALHRLYEAADGWLFVAADADHHDEVRRLAGPSAATSSGTAHESDNALAAALEHRIRQRTCAEWVPDLAARGITAQRVRSIDEVAHDPVWHERGVLRYGTNGEGQHDAPGLGWHPQPWLPAAGSRQHPGPLGADTTAFRSREVDVRPDIDPNTPQVDRADTAQGSA
jgi:crotonobetainyl-CoA:carnitine CoA-transferase CaiB-like acyl-CoA transferase